MSFNKKYNDKAVFLALFFALLIYLLDIYIDVYIFRHGTLYKNLLTPEPFEIYIRNLIVFIFIIYGLITSRIIAKLQQTNDDKNETIIALKKASNEIKILQGILPICASCKKIRDEKGSWQHIEKYINENSEADFSHSICPECRKKLYSDESKNL